jgi:probable HAF family extracellular repeat protein
MFPKIQPCRFILAALCALPMLAAAQPRYNVNVVAVAGSDASDINLAGQVVGQYYGGGATHAFMHSGGAMLDLGTLGGGLASASAINDNGQVVGVSRNLFGEEHAFSYLLGSMTDLGTLGGWYSNAAGLNLAGTIVGNSLTPSGTAGEYGVAFMRDSGGMVNLGTFPGPEDYQRSRASAINTLGHVVGTSSTTDSGPTEWPEHAFVYANGVMQDLGTLGGVYSSAEAINDSGVIVGKSSTLIDPGNIGHTVPHAFMYINGVMIDLGAFEDDMYIGSGANDVNNLGQVVGWGSFGQGSTRHAFLYEGGAMVDLNALIDPLSGWEVTAAAAINDVQQIAGTACRDGQCFAVRLDLLQAEVPEPGAALLLATALGMLALAKRRSTLS